MKNPIIKILVVITVFSVSFLAVFYVRQATYAGIAARETDNRVRWLETALPGYSIGEEQKVSSESAEGFSYWAGIKIVDDSESRGYVFVTPINGYSYRIIVNTGIDADGRITGINAFYQYSIEGDGSIMDVRGGKLFPGGFVPHITYSAIIDPESKFSRQFRGIDLNKKITVVDESMLARYSADDISARNTVAAPYGGEAAMENIVFEISNNYSRLKEVLARSEQSTEDRE